MTGFAVLALGIMRKGGFPQMNMEYAQSIIVDENTQMLGFLAIASSAGKLGLICWMPIMIHGVLICAATSRD